MRTPPDPTQLLAQTRWVRRVAGRLCSDRDLADDVSQETLRLALEGGPSDTEEAELPAGRLRAWLATTVSQVLHTGKRAERRRLSRERAAGTIAAGTEPAASDVVARAEQHELVVRAVLALDEPYRRTLLARYFDGEDSQTIAAREGITQATVRKRIERALNRLRDRLIDTREDPRASRRALLALAAGAPLPTPHPVPLGQGTAASAGPLLGVLVMKRLASLAAALLLLTATTLALWPDREDPSPEGAPGEATVGSLAGEGPDAGPPAQRLARRELDAPGSVDPRAEDEPSPAQDPRRGSLRVAAIWRNDGTPAVGRRIEVTLQGARNALDVLRTDENGAVHYANLSPGRYLVRHDVFAMRDVLVRPAEETTLELRVSEPCGIAGQVLDLAGRPVENVEVSWFDDAYDHGDVTRTDAAGRFTLEDVTSNVHLHGDLGNRRFGGEPEYLSLLLPGETRHVVLTEIAWDPPVDPDPTRAKVTVDLLVRDASGKPAGGQELTFLSIEKPVFLRNLTTDAEGRCQVAHVPVGEYLVSARNGMQHLDHTPVTVVAEGENLVELTRPSAGDVRGVVQDTGGRALSGALVQLLRAARDGNRSRQLAETSSLADGSFAFADIWPEELELVVTHPSFAAEAAPVVLEPGAVADVAVTLREGPTIRGVLLDARGAPLRGWFVGTRGGDTSWTDPAGQFDLAVAEERSFQLTATDPGDPDGYAFHRLVVDGVEPGAERMRYVVPEDTRPTAWIQGSVTHAVTGRAPSSYSVLAIDSEAGQSAPIAPVDFRTGRFRVGPLPPGNWVLWLTDGLRKSPNLEPGPFELRAHQELEVPPLVIPASGGVEVEVVPPVIPGFDPEGIVVRLLTEDGAHLSNTQRVSLEPLVFESLGELPVGAARALCFGAGIGVTQESLTIEAGKLRRVVLRPAPGLRTWLRLALPEARFQMFEVRCRVVAEADGRVVLDGPRYVTRDGDDALDLAPGRYRVRYTLASGVTGEVTIEAGSGTSERPVIVPLD